MSQEYREFSLQIDLQGDGSCRVRAAAESAEASHLTALPLRAEDLERPWVVGDDAPISVRHSRPALAGVRWDWRALGKGLFKAVFGGEVDALYASCWTAATAEGQGVRTRLHLQPKEADQAVLSRIPWELMYDDRRGVFMGLDPLSPVVRHLDLPRGTQPRRFTTPLRVLVAAASPRDAGELDLAAEQEVLRQAFAAREGVQIDVLQPASPERLRESLLAGNYQILHFMGHGVAGEAGGSLLFSRSDGVASSLSGDSLTHLLQGVASLRLTLLNACQSAAVPWGRGADPLQGVATALVRGGQAAVIGMQFPIADRAALRFSAAFYGRLAARQSLEAALAEARLALHLNRPEAPEWAAPVLFRRGALPPREPRRAGRSIDQIVKTDRIYGKESVEIVAHRGAGGPGRTHLRVDAGEIVSDGTVEIGAHSNHGRK